AAKRHRQSTHLHMHIRQLGKRLNILAPDTEALLALAFIRADAKRRADMIQHNNRLRERAAEIDQIGNLRLQQPSIEREPKLVQMLEPLAELRIKIESR